MFFRQILHPERACLSYLIGCPTIGVSAIVDPQGSPEAIVREAATNGLRITHIIETHIHADHRSTAIELKNLIGAPVYLGPGSEPAYEAVTLKDEEILRVGYRRIQALHTPGHTPEHISLLVDDWFLLTGDTLFVGDVGRIDLDVETEASGDLERRADQLYQSLQRLLRFPDWIEIYPGHYAGSVCGRDMDGKTISTIGRERRMNSTLNLNRQEFIRFQMENLPALPEDFRRIKMMNLGRAV